MEFPAYHCTGQELPGDAELIDAAGSVFNTIYASRCFADWWVSYLGNGITWRWRDGVDPDDPTTWPAPLEEPPIAPAN